MRGEGDLEQEDLRGMEKLEGMIIEEAMDSSIGSFSDHRQARFFLCFCVQISSSVPLSPSSSFVFPSFRPLLPSSVLPLSPSSAPKIRSKLEFQIANFDGTQLPSSLLLPPQIITVLPD